VLESGFQLDSLLGTYIADCVYTELQLAPIFGGNYYVSWGGSVQQMTSRRVRKTETTDSNVSHEKKKKAEISDCTYIGVKVSTNNGNNRNDMANDRAKAPQVLRTADIS
jgi:hypothetical protein